MSLLASLVAQQPGPEMAFLGFTFFLLIGVVLLIVAIAIAIWVYRDAEERGMNGVLWLLVVLLTNILGLIIYLIVRADHPKTQGNKGQDQQDGQPEGPFCSNCGERLQEGQRFCPSCGEDVTGETV